LIWIGEESDHERSRVAQYRYALYAVALNALLLAAALGDGTLALTLDGIEKVLAGLTDIKLVRVVCIK
jgi:hypothetical protein